MLRGLASGFTWDAQLASWLVAFLVLCLPIWLVEHLQERTQDLDAPLKLSILPRTALFATCLLMMLCLGNTGGHAFIYFQF